MAFLATLATILDWLAAEPTRWLPALGAAVSIITPFAVRVAPILGRVLAVFVALAPDLPEAWKRAKEVWAHIKSLWDATKPPPGATGGAS